MNRVLFAHSVSSHSVVELIVCFMRHRVETQSWETAE